MREIRAGRITPGDLTGRQVRWLIFKHAATRAALAAALAVVAVTTMAVLARFLPS